MTHRGKNQSGKGRYLILALLILTGLLLNMCAPRLFMGFNYLFGSISVLLVLRFYGIVWGTVAGLIAASWTYVLFGHPYAMVWLTAEPLFIGLVLRHTPIRNLVLINTAYWPLVGMPLLWLFFSKVMGLPFVGTLPAALMFWVIGMANSLAATIILQLSPLARALDIENEEQLITIRKAVFSMMLSIIIFPAIIVMVANGRAISDRHEQTIINRLIEEHEHYKAILQIYLEMPQFIINHTENDRLSDKLLREAGVRDVSSLQSLEAQLSADAINERKPSTARTIFAQAPQGTWAGIIDRELLFIDREKGSILHLSLPHLENHLTYASGHIAKIWTTLVDENNTIIYTTHPKLGNFNNYMNRGGEIAWSLPNGVQQILPPMPAYVTLWRRVQQSWYIFEPSEVNTYGWKWILEVPFAFFQTNLLQQQTKSLEILISLCLLALVVSFFVSRRFSSSILALTKVTSGLVDRVEHDRPVSWPESKLGEVATLVDNFKRVADSLRSKFRELKNSNKIMEAEVANRTLELKTSKEQAERIHRLMPSALLALDLERRVIIWNKKTEQVTGYAAEEVIGKKYDSLLSSEKSAPDSNSDNSEVVPGENIPVEGVESTIYNKDGEELTVSKNIDYLLDGSGNIIGYIECFEDISEKLKLEETLRQSQKMEAVGTLAGGIAHDFNNMLSVILGQTEMAMEEVDKDSSLSNKLEEIRNAGERSADLTRQLLAFARKQTISPKVLDLNKIVEGTLQMLTRLIGEDINLEWLPGKELWPVKIDPSQVYQILTNLCVNGRDAITDVGKITIKTEAIVLDELYCSNHPDSLPGDYVLMTVSDDGCGMDARTLANIFEPFFTTKKSGQGTGLGLATVYGAVKQNHGFISAHSKPDLGTTFKIYFPRYRAKTEVISAEVKDSTYRKGHETVLLVEDEPAILSMTTTMLETMGYQVLAADTPGKAIRLAREHSGDIQLLITDVVMPEMNGRDLAQNIVTNYPNIRQLFISGYTADVIAHHGVLDDGVNFIKKPFSRKELGAKVREVLDKA